MGKSDDGSRNHLRNEEESQSQNEDGSRQKSVDEKTADVTGTIVTVMLRTVKSVGNIADGRGIVSWKARGGGVVKGTARGSAFRATARAITIGIVAPIADIAMIALPLYIPVTPSPTETIAVMVAVRVAKYYFFLFSFL